MTAKEKKERESIRFEIRARKLVLKRLATPAKLAKVAAEKKEAARRARVESACAYESYQDAQNAYGWGIITEEEFDEIAEILENGSAELEGCRTPEEAAASILTDIIRHIEGDISSLEFELLPEQEKAEIRQRNMELLKKRKDREAQHD